ncbi:MAG: type IX secretion system membrane protein PorP/SprF [Saprospiraceae bacterium]|nr:type IX secretion system membrane protein PorP/SprF [Saprospiraceae bacterium]
MKKIIFSIAMLVAACVSLNAQQEGQFTQFMYNKLYVNPAYAGARGVPSLTAIYRSQWAGFDGAPQSMLASFNGPFLSKRVGVGATISHMKVGLQRDFRATVAYSYDLVAQEDLSLRVGLSGSLRSLGFAYNEAAPAQTGDLSIEDQRINDFYGNVGAGIYGTVMQRYYFGVSVPHMYSNAIGLVNSNALTLAKESQHFYGMAGAILPLSDDINLMPAVLLKYVKNAPFDADINVNLDIKQKFTAGVSYRLGGDGSGDSVDLLAFWQAAPQFGIGAAYDFTLSSLKDYNAGSFEVLLQYDLKQVNGGKKKMSNPRFFM